MAMQWRTAAPAFDHLVPVQVTRALCREWSARREKDGYSRGTIRKQLSILGAALRWQNPNTPAVVELPTQPPPRERHLTRAEADRLLAACDKSLHLRVFVVLALTTAARAGAILSLTWDQVDFQRGVIDYGRGPARNKQRALAPMNHSCREALVKAKAAAVTDHVVEYGGARVGSIKKAFARACDRASLPDVTPHVLRHTAAVWMIENGVPFEVVAQLLGHSTPKVTYQTYARYSPTYLSSAVNALEL